MSEDIAKFYITNLWRDMVGKPELPWDTNPKKMSLEEIVKSNTSPEFNRLGDNRMVQGFFRYGKLGEQGMINRVGYIINKAKEFRDTKNLECLVDIRNVAMAEYVEKKNEPGYHFESLDDKNHGEKG